MQPRGFFIYWTSPPPIEIVDFRALPVPGGLIDVLSAFESMGIRFGGDGAEDDDEEEEGDEYYEDGLTLEEMMGLPKAEPMEKEEWFASRPMKFVRTYRSLSLHRAG